MKRTLLLAGLLCLALSVTVCGQNLKGEMMIGGYAGYTLGFGDAFKDYEEPGFKLSSSAGFNFGGMFHYGINEKMMIGGELGLQQYKADMEAVGTAPIGTIVVEGSDTETKLNILFNGLYALNYTEDKAMFLTAGAGIYDSDFGLFGGILYRWAVSPTVFVFAMPRFHIVLADSTFELLQLSAGVQIPIGAKK